ncbi:hypothetical protein ABH19_04875 [Leptospirillum sp. Group II 'CF-1']|jgi:hypothetical protein|uniref:hypothetical protein n=1 Tax=Leptospirillum sp. Group II 'CF-1' TaxID=1660083 RepID=UPI0002E96041|nr:hypothetical protein [Leptospirillum sp. Group II 'CF-1']AKS23224.1 hypothetical protein ABH19_04875 [Leptospirillum sp. Group II 'CF-1']
MTFFRAEAAALLEATVDVDDDPLDAVFAGEEAEDEELAEAVDDGLALEEGEDVDVVLLGFAVVLVPVLLAVFVPLELEPVEAVDDRLALEEGEDEDAVLLGFAVVLVVELVPVLLAALVPVKLVDGLVLEEGEDEVLEEVEEAFARSDLYVFSSRAIVFTNAFRLATSFLISERRSVVISFCSFFRSANADRMDFNAALSAATAALFPDFSSARMSASSFRSRSRILSSLFRSRWRVRRYFKISIRRLVDSFSSAEMVLLNEASVVLEVVELAPEVLEAVGVAVLVPVVEDANAFPETRSPTKTAAIPTRPIAIEMDFPGPFCIVRTPLMKVIVIPDLHYAFFFKEDLLEKLIRSAVSSVPIPYMSNSGRFCTLHQ